MENENFDVIIIGAGVIGLCAGYYLSIKNIKVLILENEVRQELVNVICL